MLTLISTPDEDQNLVEFLVECLKTVQEEQSTRIVFSVLCKDTNDSVVYYNNCSVMDLRCAADAIDDEATLRVIAYNQDRVERFAEEYEESAENDD